MDTKGNELNSTRRTEEHDTRGTPEEQKKTRKGSVKMEETRNINDILKQIDTQNDYNESEALDNYFYNNYIVEY